MATGVGPEPRTAGSRRDKNPAIRTESSPRPALGPGAAARTRGPHAGPPRPGPHSPRPGTIPAPTLGALRSPLAPSPSAPRSACRPGPPALTTAGPLSALPSCVLPQHPSAHSRETAAAALGFRLGSCPKGRVRAAGAATGGLPSFFVPSFMYSSIPSSIPSSIRQSLNYIIWKAYQGNTLF